MEINGNIDAQKRKDGKYNNDNKIKEIYIQKHVYKNKVKLCFRNRKKTVIE